MMLVSYLNAVFYKSYYLHHKRNIRDDFKINKLHLVSQVDVLTDGIIKWNIKYIKYTYSFKNRLTESKTWSQTLAHTW